MESLCVFCGSASGGRPAYEQAAREVGKELAQRKIRLIYGGGKVGMMGALAEGCLSAGGEVVGVIPGALVNREMAHHGINDLIIVESMHERKARMSDLADGFLTLPGGFGTFEEMFEVLTWAQLGFHPKPCGLLNIEGYFDPLLTMLDHAVSEGFLKLENRELLVTASQADLVIECLKNFVVDKKNRWIDRSET